MRVTRGGYLVGFTMVELSVVFTNAKDATLDLRLFLLAHAFRARTG